jgi:hypothetical protein
VKIVEQRRWNAEPHKSSPPSEGGVAEALRGRGGKSTERSEKFLAYG